MMTNMKKLFLIFTVLFHSTVFPADTAPVQGAHNQQSSVFKYKCIMSIEAFVIVGLLIGIYIIDEHRWNIWAAYNKLQESNKEQDKRIKELESTPKHSLPDHLEAMLNETPSEQ